MIPATTFRGQRVAVFGLGKSGIASAKSLVAGGAAPVCWDDSEKSRAAAAAEGLTVLDLNDIEWGGMAALVLAPGVPLTHPAPHWTVRKAEEAGVPVIGDLEIFSLERARHAPDAPFVAITGTNGKSTTTALIAHLLVAAGRDVQLGGNIGTATLSLKPPATGRYHVLECSSFQIETAPSVHPSVGVHLNLSPDHLDRHGTFERYASIKAGLAAASDVAVVGVDDVDSARIADHVAQAGGRVIRISQKQTLAHGVTVRDGVVIAVENGAATPIAPLAGIPSLRGAHNAQNATAAVAVLLALGVAKETIAPALKTFPGLPHRMEEVGRRGHVLYVNDSKATNADATGKALASFNHIYWIVGGRPKSDGLTGLDPFFPRIARAFLIGEAAEAFAGVLEGQVPFEIVGTLEAATAAASAMALSDASPEAVVLLSPACASFDQFRSFEHRGDVFRGLVASLPGVSRRGVAA
ncbi:MAG: UDP-N-acetylmuramoyl-L-alanine--D-glutamate ligase [Bauldia sp.]